MKRSAALLAATVLLAGCGGGRDADDDTRRAPGDALAATARAADPWDAPAPAVVGAAGHAVPTLRDAGEIALADGRVERAYRLRFVNGPRFREGVVAELLSAGPGVEIVQARVEVGDLAPAAQATPPGTVTLRHGEALEIVPGQLRWRLHEQAIAGRGPGRLLGGPSEQAANEALTSYRAEPPGAGSPPRVAAVLEAEATVAMVNEALRAGGLRIVEMRPGSRALTLAAVAATDAPALQRGAERLEASAAFELVRVLPAVTTQATGGPATAAVAAPGDTEAAAACES